MEEETDSAAIRKERSIRLKKEFSLKKTPFFVKVQEKTIWFSR